MAQLTAQRGGQRYSESEVRELLTSELFKKKFLKRRCGQCDVQCFRVKFGGTSPLIVRAQISSFWCADCGRLLCDAHRNQHHCERVEAKRAAERKLTGDEIRERARVEEERRVAREEADAAERRRRLELKHAETQKWKGRRTELASLSTHVANFVQRLARAAQPGRERDELLELYTSCNRINLRLCSEADQPSSSKFCDAESWTKLRHNYDRVKDLTGLQCVVDDMPLDLDGVPPDFFGPSSESR
mmetsp:Transcript_30544/g.93357  ORF Transcript_30544/g.93357 Transcript_30544/m.93357 type:complete len:245 (+) Transcript_30544:94-828(+)